MCELEHWDNDHRVALGIVMGSQNPLGQDFLCRAEPVLTNPWARPLTKVHSPKP